MFSSFGVRQNIYFSLEGYNKESRTKTKKKLMQTKQYENLYPKRYPKADYTNSINFHSSQIGTCFGYKIKKLHMGVYVFRNHLCI